MDINAEKKIIKDCFIYNKYDKRNIYKIVSDTLHIAILSTHNNIEYTILYRVHNEVERTQYSLEYTIFYKLNNTI